MKQTLRAALGPFLPMVRSLRILPARLRARADAARFTRASDIAVCYLAGQFPIRPPLRTEISHGGAVKLTFLASTFPHSYPAASLLYTVSSLDHSAKTDIVRIAREKGLKIILNQNGVSYPAWRGPGWQIPNDRQRETYQLADFIIFQSRFCQIGADTFLGHRDVPSAILFNPVDVDFFKPPAARPAHTAPVLLLGGNQFSAYRFEQAAQVCHRVRTHLPGTKLVVTGKLWGEDPALSMRQAYELAGDLGIQDNLEFTGTYSQERALSIFQQADILIHTQFQDASPGLVGEALACGMPVVYSASGGTPELVCPEAGIGVPVEASWEQINLANPQLMADGVLTVWQNYQQFSKAARQCALDRLSLENYTKNHHEIFTRVLG